MSRKAFLIWGFVIISLFPAFIAIVQYLSISRIIEIEDAAIFGTVALLIATLLMFGTILNLRFKKIGRRKRILALCLFLYLFTLTMTGPSMLYNEYVIANSGAETRFFGAIGEWAKTYPSDSEVIWTEKQKLDYVLIVIPMNYLYQWGLFALLWFGSLDPRTPSKTGFIRFMKHGFQRKTAGKPSGENSKSAVG